MSTPSQEPIKAGPKWAGPEQDVPGAALFTAPPYRPVERLTHAAAVAGLGVAVGIHGDYLYRHRRELLSSPVHSLVALAGGVYCADLASGLLHWAFDTWFTEHTPVVRRVVLIVREHHIYPQRVFNYPISQDVGIMAPFGVLAAVPTAWLLLRGRAGAPAAIASLSYSVLVTVSLDLHKLGHRTNATGVLRWAQRTHLVLSPAWHFKHHAKEHDDHYCLVNGIADATLGRAGLFRFLERTIATTTGAQPRADDRAWRRRFGRWVSPNRTHPSRHTSSASTQKGTK
ncbi:fatty acid desaturase CarF family protein [Gordonia sputi]|uniref:fatty acid desaturase CarF family protein n=1 Tax=Gordonia sputi TaxID=36823 RepID=UPI00226EFAD3|nr:fatty acid desaturase CarF family protein [Gordonia sputi]